MPEASELKDDEAKKESLSSVAHMDNIERVVMVDGKTEGRDEDPFGDNQLGDYTLSHESTYEQVDEPITDEDNDKPDSSLKEERREEVQKQEVKMKKEKKPKPSKQKTYHYNEKSVLFYVLTSVGSVAGLVLMIYLMWLFVTPKESTRVVVPETQTQTQTVNPNIVSGNNFIEQPQTQSNENGEIAPIQSIDQMNSNDNVIIVE